MLPATIVTHWIKAKCSSKLLGHILKRCCLLLRLLDGIISGHQVSFTGGNAGPCSLSLCGWHLGTLSPAKSSWTHDSFTVFRRKLVKLQDYWRNGYFVYWDTLWSQTRSGNHFCLYVSLIQEIRLSNILFQKRRGKRKPWQKSTIYLILGH